MATWPDLEVDVLLERLVARGVDFVVIGGIAVVLLGSARLTRDLDICFATDDGNLEALAQVLVELDSKLRDAPDDLPFVPDARTLRQVELLTLTTRAGWLDILSKPQGVAGYGRLRKNAERLDVGEFSVLVASVDDMISMKEAAGRLKDKADIAELEAIKRLRGRG